VVFTKGLLETLNKREIEAVAAHELSHITNKDSMLMLITVVFIGIISVLGEVLIRVRFGGNNKDNRLQMLMVLVGLAFLLLGYLIYPLIRLAISRKREYLADAGSVELTKDNQAMISALQKIAGHSAVPSANKNIAMFFIESPSVKDEEVMGMKKKTRSSLRDTHPSIDERISVLQHF
jgi:heat shock protein HtpX